MSFSSFTGPYDFIGVSSDVEPIFVQRTLGPQRA
jgi:hypothetical protein